MRSSSSPSGRGGSILAFMMKTGHFKDTRQANRALIIVAVIFIAVTIGVFYVAFGSSGPRQLTQEEVNTIIDERISDKAPLEVQERRRKQIEQNLLKR